MLYSYNIPHDDTFDEHTTNDTRTVFSPCSRIINGA